MRRPHPARLWPAVAGWSKRLVPQTVRVRMSILYAALFLAAGATLLGLTYGLVAGSLPTQTPRTAAIGSVQEQKLKVACRIALETPTTTPATKEPLRPKAESSSCKKVFSAGAAAAANSQRDQTLHNLLVFSLLGLAVMTVVSGALGWLMAGRVLRPVRAITGAARRASHRHLGERLALEGPRDELKELADTFDEMLDRLDAAFAGQQRFVADASHELRTPLTVMRTAIDVTLAKPARSAAQLETMAAKVRRSVDQAEALVDALLTLAASDRELAREDPVDLSTVAEDVLESVGPALAPLGLRLDRDLAPAATVGDAVLLERLVGNLVDNAVRHNEGGGWVEVRTGRRHGAAFVAVSNTGPVVAEESVPSLFEPFRRVEERTGAGSGFGLGLAIVRSIAAVHGATIEAHSRTGGGLSVSVAFSEDPSPDTDAGPPADLKPA